LPPVWPKVRFVPAKKKQYSLNTNFKTAAPLVGAGMDRIAHAWFVENITPMELAARAAIRLGIVGAASGLSAVDLLS
jgi:hypothetical protein